MTEPDSKDLTLAAVRERIAREPDVRGVLEIAAIGGGRFRYLIETPFATFPRYVIGTTDAKCEEVSISFKCGAEWNARNAWDEYHTRAWSGIAAESEVPA